MFPKHLTKSITDMDILSGARTKIETFISVLRDKVNTSNLSMAGLSSPQILSAIIFFSLSSLRALKHD